MPDKDDDSKYLLEKQEVELQKLKLDRERSELEVRDLKRPWYRKPQYVLAALPTTLALVGIIAGIYTGYFREKIGNLEEQKKELARSNEKSQANLKDLDNTVNQLNKERNVATDDLKLITTEKETLLTEQRDLARQVASLNTDRSLSQGDLQRIREEYSKLDKRSEELTARIASLQTDLSTADIKSLAELWLGTNKKEDADLEENDDARTQIVNLYRQRPMQQKQYQSFLKGYLTPTGSPEKYISIVSLLLELTEEPEWKKELMNLTRGNLRAIKTDEEKSYSALSKIIECAKKLESGSDETPKEQSLIDELQDIMLSELEKGELNTPTTGSVLWLFVDSVSSGVPRSIRRSNPLRYLRIVKIGRNVAIELDDSGLRHLRRYSPTAFLAVIAYLIQKQKPVDIMKYVAITRPSRVMTKLEVPTSKNLDEWKSWADKPPIKRLVELWFEDDLKTFKSNPELLHQLAEEGEVS